MAPVGRCPTLLLFFLFLSLSVPAVHAHYHEGLLVSEGRVEVRQLSATAAEVRLQLTYSNPDAANESYRAYVAFPVESTDRSLGPPGNLTPFAGILAPVRDAEGEPAAVGEAPVPVEARYRVEVREGRRLEVRIPQIYATTNFTVVAHPLDGYEAAGLGFALGEPRSYAAAADGSTIQFVTVAFDPEETSPLLYLGAAAVLLLAGAAALDYVRRRRKQP
ncbi:MAG TPA: hypothetical protein VNZ52_08500 [Candidatus Thermoplasmatota archaeon]|nr:hypothetical protein [Candidatus Thermoplasmatota archaeon]